MDNEEYKLQFKTFLTFIYLHIYIYNINSIFNKYYKTENVSTHSTIHFINNVHYCYGYMT